MTSIRAGLADEVLRTAGDWLFVDLGFSRASRSCSFLDGDGKPEVLTFGDLVSRVSERTSAPGPRLCLLLEAPLSVAFTFRGNPTGRRPERRGSEHRYWYAGLGTTVLTSATYLLRAVAGRGCGREVLLFEGFASFKAKGRISSHVEDVLRLREVVWSPWAHPGAVIPPDQLTIDPTDRLSSAFAVAGMDFGVPPVICLER